MYMHLLFNVLSFSLQINVYADSQKAKMSYFEGFSRKALVVIPPHHELRKRRVDRIREGCCMEVPQNVIDAFKGTHKYYF